jgi:hypothetical protein
MACARKYLIADSVDLKFNSLIIRGIKLIRLISNPNQHVNHEFDDTATKVPVIINVINIIVKFLINIKEEENYTLI